MLDKIISYLEGKKTYIVAVITALFTVLEVFGVVNVTPEQRGAIYALLAAMFGAAIRASIK